MSAKFLSKRYHNRKKSVLTDLTILKENYQDLLDLSLGDPQLPIHQKVIADAVRDVQQEHKGYAEPAGDPQLRAEISRLYQKKYGQRIGLADIMVVVGACHGMYLALRAILDNQDEVIIHEPFFTPYKDQIELAGGKVIVLQTSESERFQIDLKKLEKLITTQTKAIIINTPTNPTGACFSKDILEAICQLVIEKDLLLISDEVYSSFCFHEEFSSLLTFKKMRERTVVIGSFSKSYAMTGWRIGYVIAPEHIIGIMEEINEGICYSAPTISQRAAISALKLSAEITPQVTQEFKKRVNYAYLRIQKIPGLSTLEPQGSFYLFVNIKTTGLSSREFCQKLLREAHLLVIPGTAFGESGEGYIRIACTLAIDQLKIAFDRIEKLRLI